jgi:hypothetical protein
MPRKHSKFQTCERHRDLEALPRRRRAELFLEGGPAERSGCRGGRCRLWPGTDIFDPIVCNHELPLDWTT